MAKFKKYSCNASDELVVLLVHNGIEFSFKRGLQTQRMRVFFIASVEMENIIREFTHFYCTDESDGWDFDNWEMFNKFNLLDHA